MTHAPEPFAEGGCGCGEIRYRLMDVPIVVHCCHCHLCQQETGSAFALNAVIETDNLRVEKGAPEIMRRPTGSGAGQEVAVCPTCKTAVWSMFAGAGPQARFVRAGTLDNPALCPPSVHIFTESKLPWVTLPEGAEVFERFYRGADVPRVYGEHGAARWAAVRAANR